MSGKSRRGRFKRSSQGKKRKYRLSAATMAAQQPAVTREPVESSKAAAPSASVPTSTPTPAAVRYPLVTTELRRIGILAGIMLVILVVLALILP
jgi:hypothetical protein